MILSYDSNNDDIYYRIKNDDNAKKYYRAWNTHEMLLYVDYKNIENSIENMIIESESFRCILFETVTNFNKINDNNIINDDNAMKQWW